MYAAEPLELYHSWPRAERDARFDLGLIGTVAPLDLVCGRWSCDLADNRLTWDATVFALFGFPAGETPTRADTVACYREPSRAAMERLRAHAIRHRRGFTLDVEVRPVAGVASRWIRLGAVPICAEGRAVRLEGYKADVTALYA